MLTVFSRFFYRFNFFQLYSFHQLFCHRKYSILMTKVRYNIIGKNSL